VASVAGVTFVAYVLSPRLRQNRRNIAKSSQIATITAAFELEELVEGTKAEPVKENMVIKEPALTTPHFNRGTPLNVIKGQLYTLWNNPKLTIKPDSANPLIEHLMLGNTTLLSRELRIVTQLDISGKAQLFSVMTQQLPHNTSYQEILSLHPKDGFTLKTIFEYAPFTAKQRKYVRYTKAQLHPDNGGDPEIFMQFDQLNQNKVEQEEYLKPIQTLAELDEPTIKTPGGLIIEKAIDQDVILQNLLSDNLSSFTEGALYSLESLAIDLCIRNDMANLATKFGLKFTKIGLQTLNPLSIFHELINLSDIKIKDLLLQKIAAERIELSKEEIKNSLEYLQGIQQYHAYTQLLRKIIFYSTQSLQLGTLVVGGYLYTALFSGSILLSNIFGSEIVYGAVNKILNVIPPEDMKYLKSLGPDEILKGLHHLFMIVRAPKQTGVTRPETAPRFGINTPVPPSVPQAKWNLIVKEEKKTYNRFDIYAQSEETRSPAGVLRDHICEFFSSLGKIDHPPKEPACLALDKSIVQNNYHPLIISNNINLLNRNVTTKIDPIRHHNISKVG